MSSEPGTTRYHTRWHRWARFVAQRLILGPVVRLVTKVRVTGKQHLAELDGSFVLVTNHSSHLDAPLLVTQLPYKVTKQLAVAAAADYFYQRWWMKALTSLFFNSYPVSRNVSGMRRGGSLSQSLLAEGVPIVIFPEGTRSRDGVMKRFKSGAAALCLDQAVPCLPIALVGTSDAMPVGTFWPKLGRPRVEMHIGSPLTPATDESVREFNGRVEAHVSTMLAMRTSDVASPPKSAVNPQRKPQDVDAAEGEAS